jgi:hypothetical protein
LFFFLPIYRPQIIFFQKKTRDLWADTSAVFLLCFRVYIGRYFLNRKVSKRVTFLLFQGTLNIIFILPTYEVLLLFQWIKTLKVILSIRRISESFKLQNVQKFILLLILLLISALFIVCLCVCVLLYVRHNQFIEMFTFGCI